MIMQYMDDLLKMKQGLQARGNLQGMQQVEAEIRRFRRYRHWDTSRRDGIGEGIEPLVQRYKEYQKKLNTSYLQKIRPVLDQYRARLKSLQIELTKQNRIDEAVTIKDALTEPLSPPRVTQLPMPEGQEAKRLTTPKEVTDFLGETRWRLRWLRGDAAKEPERIDLKYGGLAVTRIMDKTRRPVFQVHPDNLLQVQLGTRGTTRLVFDPSYSTFVYYDDYYRLERFGVLEQSLRPESDWKKDLLLYYSFDAPEEVVTDGSGQTRHGQTTKLLNSWDGRRNACAFFDGYKSKINCPLALGNESQFSISFWYKPDERLRAGYLLYVRSVADEKPRHATIYVSRDKLYARVRTYESQQFRFEPETWYHVVVSHDRSSGTSLYVNGKHIATHPIDHEIADQEWKAMCMIGAGQYGNDWNYYRGLLDEYLVFKRSLSPEQVQLLYDANKPPPSPEPGPSPEPTPPGAG